MKMDGVKYKNENMKWYDIALVYLERVMVIDICNLKCLFTLKILKKCLLEKRMSSFTNVFSN